MDLRYLRAIEVLKSIKLTLKLSVANYCLLSIQNKKPPDGGFLLSQLILKKASLLLAKYASKFA